MIQWFVMHVKSKNMLIATSFCQWLTHVKASNTVQLIHSVLSAVVNFNPELPNNGRCPG